MRILSIVIVVFYSLASFAETSFSFETSLTLASLQNVTPEFQVLYNTEMPYKELLLDSNYTDQNLNLKNLVQDHKDLSAEELGQLIFDSNNIANAYGQFVSGNSHTQTLTQQEVYSAVGTVFRSLLESETINVNDVRDTIAEFGKDASLEAKILFLQIFADINQRIYDNGKIANTEWSWNGEYRTETEEILEGMRIWLEGGDADGGVCYDTELMMNEFAPLLGLTGAIVLGNNRYGMMHPQGLFFDTSDPDRTIAILQDWDRIAAIEVNTPTQLADALTAITGSHLLARVLYDGEGHPLKMIHNTSDRITLEYLGKEELQEAIASLINDGLIDNDYLIKNSSLMAAAEAGNFRLEVREFQNLVADHNLMFVVHHQPDPKTGEFLTKTHETELAYIKEGEGFISNYNQQNSNEHFKVIFRHFTSLETKKMNLVKDMLSLSLYTSFEAVMGYFDFGKDSVRYKNGVTIPILESVTGATFQLFERSEDGMQFSLSPFVSLDYILPRDIGNMVGSVSNYMNAVLNEAHLYGQAQFQIGRQTYISIDMDYIYSNIDHTIHLGTTLHDERGVSLQLYYENGFTNNNFPIFYRQSDPTIGLNLSTGFENNKGNTFNLGVFFETIPRQENFQVGISARYRYK